MRTLPVVRMARWPQVVAGALMLLAGAAWGKAPAARPPAPAAGKNGLKLSLFGYDPQSDYAAITRWGGARRVTRAQPDRSLILRKPTLQIRHGGGQRFVIGSPPYLLLRDWITGGLPAPRADEPRVARLEVIPAVRTLALGQSQRFIVQAHYSDGSQRDVTGQTLFTTSDETV